MLMQFLGSVALIQNKRAAVLALGHPMCLRRLNKEQWYVLLHLKKHSKVFILELIIG